MSRCFVQVWNWSSLATVMANWLSQYRSIRFDKGRSISPRNMHIYIASLAAWVIVTYSDSMVDSKIITCFLEFQETAPPSMQNA